MTFNDFYNYHYQSKINAVNEDDYCYHLAMVRDMDSGKINKKNFRKFLVGKNG